MRATMRTTSRRLGLATLVVVCLAGCGSSGTHSASSSTGATSTGATSTGATSTGATSTGAGSSSTSQTGQLPPAIAQLPAAEHPRAGQFPPARGRTLAQLAALVKSSAQLGAATGSFTPGRRRYAFALTAKSGAFIYAPTALYIARTPQSPAQGPFLAPADPMTVAPPYRSRQNSGPGGIQAIYETDLPLPHKGTFTVLALTRGPSGLLGSPGEVAVAAHSPIPDVGQRPPDINTDTLASVHGKLSLLTTRVPPDDMHQVSLRQVLGRRPVALLFSTPQLCISKVCGPVTDIAVELEHTYGRRIAFIHEEVYVDNQPSRGLRPQLKAFHLQTEPWLFTIDRRGVIAARLEGSFGVNAFRRALGAALR
jgi:hypothetical protein